MTKKFTEDHEWVSVDGDIGTVGITKYAAEQLGDVVFVGPPDAGTQVSQGDDMAVVESVKAASDVYAPVAGEVTERNPLFDEERDDDPDWEPKYETVNEDPEGAGWFCKIKLSDAGELDGLMDAAAYKTFCEGL
ncbi:MAG: glycine cleavage system protein GcvH [Pseudomonadota bacterium]